MNHFCVADLNVHGELRTRQAYAYASLERLPGCRDLIADLASLLYRLPGGFDAPLANTDDLLTLRFAAIAPTAGIATLRTAGRVTSVSLVLTGLDAEADTITRSAYQRHLVRLHRDSGYEPAFDLLDLDDRPLVATLDFPAAETQPFAPAAAIADRCFAAAYFRYHRLV